MDIKRQLKIKNEYLKTIYAIGCDYDGCNQVNSLKEVINTLCNYAIMALKNDDKTIFFGGKIGDFDMGTPRNILMEEIQQDEN